jgi:hypothetical protein
VLKGVHGGWSLFTSTGRHDAVEEVLIAAQQF